MKTETAACDAHIHIYDPRFAAQAPIEENAGVPQYRALQARLGLKRAVVVQPRVYGTDNSATLQAIADLGLANARGIAVVDRDIDDARLAALHEGGIRGIRFSFHSPNKDAGDFETVARLAQRIAALGWHVQLHWTADQIAQQESLLRQLPVPIVFDHMARLPPGTGLSHPAFGIVRSLLASGRAWLKLSGPYLNTAFGVHGGYPDTDAIARAWIEAAPEQLVWGSDWPHVTEPVHKPDDAELLELLSRWCCDPAVRQQILTTNPARLYGFHDH
ncbi:amidohydrolase family protein [Paracandidimonas soli]|uniref:Putative TIM-barrel fold metal-dependent hydrolase n=1 Tax=Paracandidimonas soli TaxID=1917182 RepID=A0A4R3VF87_9BURK|nr:amidohydrolase family protein [Paracandidimonas soli]TCV02901.1 putative TIM-barrel fold metal-dependent hydrolase [Paracandidimonas soli]